MSVSGPLSRTVDDELYSPYSSQTELPAWKVEKEYKKVLAHRGNELDFESRLERLNEKIRDGLPRSRLASYMLQYMTSELALKAAWNELSMHGGESPGPDGLHYNDMDHRQIWATLRVLSHDLSAFRYRRRLERVSQHPKPSGGYRQIVLQSILDRTVDKAAAMVVTKFSESFFLPMSFAYRPNMNTHDALSYAMKCATKQNLMTWVCVDLRDAFTRVPLPRLVDIFHKYFPNKQLLAYIKLLLEDAPVKGLRQGSPLSSVLLNIYLHHVLDRKWAKRKGQRLIRWADDLLVMCDGPAQAKLAYSQLRDLLVPHGMQIKESREEAIRGLTSTSPAQWLGFQISFSTKESSSKIFHVNVPESAWVKLKENLLEAHSDPNSPLRADEVITAWLNHYAPACRKPKRQALCDRMVGVARESGFEEIQPEAETIERMKKLWKKWVGLRDGV